MKIMLWLILSIHLIIISLAYAIKINSVVWSYDDGSLFRAFTNDFNDYSKKNNLDIELEFNLFTFQNVTNNFVTEYDSTIDYLLSRKSNKYDIYFYDVQYSRKYYDHFINLADYLKKEHIEKYENDLAPQICKYNGKWVGLPLYINYSVLHSNVALLEKYGLDIPKTWDQLLEYAEKILKGEAEEGNTGLIGYNGLIPENESNVCSIHEYIYSFRETPQSPFPGYASETAIEALEKFKEIKDRISSTEAFLNTDDFSISGLFMQNFIFLKFWYIPIDFPGYKKTMIVGKNEGVSGTTIGGYNIAVSKYVDEEHRNAAIKVIEFFTSEEYQKEITNYQVFSGMRSIYNDEELCKKVDCEMEKQYQPIARPSYETDDYDEFSTYFVKYIHQFLKGNITASEALNSINNLIKFYSISINPKESTFGFISFIISILTILIMIGSYFLIFNEHRKPKFEFLSNDLWFVSIFGLILYMSVNFLEYGYISDFKCQTKYIFRVFGLIFTFTPHIYKMCTISPLKNKATIWIEGNKYLFLLFVFVINVIICGLSFISPSKGTDKKIDQGKNFRICNGERSFFSVLLILEEVAIFLVISVYAFLEWHITKTVKDVRTLQSSAIVFLFLIILLNIVNGLNVSSYEVYFIIHWLLFTLISISNYILLFGIRFVWQIGKEDSLKKVRSTTLNSRTRSTSSNNLAKDGSTPTIISKVVNCHYNRGTDENINKSTQMTTNCCSENYTQNTQAQSIQSTKSKT
ncbi:hypothetical protein BCR36DRAFT_585012 [Piromyces finnis]|uniref:G-protein coupled receptors family 3 profile domain-containing protein n=1 Tax=Piromyces finnis TaxID=1754191 RepID=A0A1Y1V4E3_9FUNG|nr:hypothetical protein BCR36DRAFT_585012 [Piromyces finnis]|eukprot:ORX46906.1 hypothetical protein BCR36DRAFT_585012 [Piromyces finnis]